MYNVITEYLGVIGADTTQKIKQDNISSRKIMNKIDELMNQIESLLPQKSEAK